jgi:N-acetylglucosamine malate deacetylase 1
MRILTVVAHPDDETLGAGGTMARFAADGHDVMVLIMTDGVGARHDQFEQQRLCAVRACETLGVTNVSLAGLPDQRLDTMALMDLAGPMEKAVSEFRPDVMFTHYQEDVNQDHRAVFRAASIAARPTEGTSVRRFLCFETASSTEWAAPFPGTTFAPNVFVDISETLEVKLAAMRCYADTFESEVKPYPHPRSLEALEIYARHRGASTGVLAAEAFMQVRHVVRADAPEHLVAL